MGLQDFVGTGMHEAEYLVFSKSFKNIVRTSFGLGWGRLSSLNKIGSLGTRDYTSKNKSFGGTVNFGTLFKGDIGAFGGLEYKTPINKLTLKAEITSDSYERASSYYEKLPDTKFNFGADYSFNENFRSIEHAQSLGLQLNIRQPNKSYAGNFM